ncbi:hypothetical protein BGZ70_000888 [Mortierella alpina]|uniref:Uncharacterized protein n=1 Tax=Mortierella alpina TaxID=64518 RepID=A0A9P6IWY2_MORAP|nr:hypothetical protein BGZ70_000888 [Mortierella alpina]
MNRDRDPTQVMDLPSSSSPTVADDPTAGLSKIKATALLLKQKVAGTSIKAQKVPNKISHPWAITSSSSRSASFSSPTSPYSNSGHGHGHFGQSSNPTLPLSSSAVGSASGAGGKGIKAMIAAREDPALSCNKMAPGGTQPVPAPQKRDVRAGMTKVQLSPQPQPSPQPQVQQPPPAPPAQAPTQVQQAEPSPSQQHDEKQKGHGQEGAGQEERVTGMENEVDQARRSTRRRNGGGAALVASQFAAPTSSTGSTPLFMKAFEDPRMVQAEAASLLPTVPTQDTTPTAVNKTTLVESRKKSSKSSSGSRSSSTNEPALSPTTSTSSSTATTKTTHTPHEASASSKLTCSTSPTAPTGARRQPPSASVFEQRPAMSPRRHTTSDSPRSSSSSGFFTLRKDSPPLPSIPQQSMSIVNPTLRQLQTPHIPTNLVQARILQQEEQKRRDEELAKIPITANLRTVKKIQAVLVSSDDEEDDDIKRRKASGRGKDEGSASSSAMSSPSSSASSSLSASSSRSSRPRSKTAASSSVSVSVLSGGKQRGDRNHVGPVAIPKRLADQVEHILGRKLAGKGNVLDEREKEREEEEARKAAEPLPPIVLGKPRKRAVTSSHIRNLVSSWDHKVEEAKETTTEAERIRQFLEERSSAHAEMPKPKVPLTATDLLAPLPSLPPPPPTSEFKTRARHGSRAGGGGVGHTKGASSAAAAYSTQTLKSGLLSPSAAETMKDCKDAQTNGLATDATTATTTTTTTPMKRLSRSASKKILGDANEAGYVSGPELGGSRRSDDEAVDRVMVVNTATASSPPTASMESQGQDTHAFGKLDLPIEVLDTKRSGALLDNKAVASRPRRKGVRGPA